MDPPQPPPALGPVFGAQRARAPSSDGAHPVRRAPLAAAALRELEFDGRPANAPRAAADDIRNAAMLGADAIVDGLRTGTDAQRSLILFEVQQLLANTVSGEFALKTVVPVICDRVTAWTHDLQICAAEALVGMQVNKLPHDQGAVLVETAFAVLRQNRDGDSFRAWGDILVKVLTHVDWTETDLHRILALLDEQHALSIAAPAAPAAPAAHTAPSTAVSRRRHQSPSHACGDHTLKLTARVIGPVAVSAPKALIANVLLPRALALASEPDVEVRGMVVESLAYIGGASDIATVETSIWPALLTLARDPNARLHGATLRTVSRISGAHRMSSPNARLFTDFLPPVFLRECQYLRRHANADQRLVDDSTYLLIEINSEIFGELLLSCCKYLTDETTRKDAYRAYYAMATCNGPVVRRLCAFNFPGVASSLTKRTRGDMASIAEFLSRDADAETRWNLAAGMHETVKVLCDSDTIETLFKTVNALLHDQSPLVRMNVLKNLDNLLATLSAHNPLKASKRLEPVFQNLQMLSEGNWRTQELLAKQMRLVAPLVPPQCIRENVLPLLYQLTGESSYTVRKAAMGAVAVCMRCIPDTTERDQVMENFRLQWGRGRVFWMRLGFVDSAEVALETYSRILFRDTFGAELLRLAHDPVPNVRIRVAQIMHKIAPACHQMDDYNATLLRLQGDKDRDVQQCLQNAVSKINDELDLAQSNFERDMLREADEQDLYSKHLQLMAEGHKKRTAVRQKTNAILGVLSPRGTNSTPSNSTQSSTQAVNSQPVSGLTGSIPSSNSSNDPIADGPFRKQKLPRSATVTYRSGFPVSRIPRGATFSGSPRTGGPAHDPEVLASTTPSTRPGSTNASILPESVISSNGRTQTSSSSGSRSGAQNNQTHKHGSRSDLSESPFVCKTNDNDEQSGALKSTRSARMSLKAKLSPRQSAVTNKTTR